MSGKERLRFFDKLRMSGKERRRFFDKLRMSGGERLRFFDRLRMSGKERLRFFDRLRMSGKERLRFFDKLRMSGDGRTRNDIEHYLMLYLLQSARALLRFSRNRSRSLGDIFTYHPFLRTICTTRSLEKQVTKLMPKVAPSGALAVSRLSKGTLRENGPPSTILSLLSSIWYFRGNIAQKTANMSSVVANMAIAAPHSAMIR